MGTHSNVGETPAHRQAACHYPRVRIRRALERRVSKLEYKTIVLPYKPSVFQGDSLEVQTALNAEAEQDWRLSQVVLPSQLWGRSSGILAILERPKQ